jgi:hypothetical protein
MLVRIAKLAIKTRSGRTARKNRLEAVVDIISTPLLAQVPDTMPENAWNVRV